MLWNRRNSLLALPLLVTSLMMAQNAPQPVNPKASPEARALLGYFYALSGQYTLTGQHNYPLSIARWTDRTLELTGKMPAIYGQDFGFQGGEDKDSALARPAMIAEVRRQFEHGAIPTLTWHALRPLSDEPVNFKDDVQGKLTDAQWAQLLTPGTELRRRWEAQADVIAGYLKQLQAAHVPVLMRPCHEMNGGWFWWGGRKGSRGSAALYRMFYDRMVNVHHLDNLLWVWNINSPDWPGMEIEDYYPGADVVDILSMDIYGEFKKSHYDKIVKLAAGKPVALGEVGYVPSPEVLKQQPLWSYFMVWSEWVEEQNPLQSVLDIYNSPQAASRDDARVKAGMEAVLKASDAAPVAVQPVTADAMPETKALLARLSEGKQILSGAEEGRELKWAGKQPAVLALDLAKDKNLVAAATAQVKAGGLVEVSWKPASPNGKDKLTDAEWKELLNSGSELNKAWLRQVDEAAASLQALQSAGIAVLFEPLPESNGKVEWWANRPGIYGSSELYRQLFAGMTGERKLKNLVWVWRAATPPGWPDATGQYYDYFPGLLYADALAVDLADGNWGRSRERELAVLATFKPVGLHVTGKVAGANSLDASEHWRWLTVAKQAEDASALGQSPRLATLPAR